MGTQVPPWYDEKETSRVGLLVAAFFFGASMAIAAFDVTQASRQSYKSWGRSRRANIYIIMVWAEITSCIASAVCIWLFLLAKIPPSIWYFVGMLCTWVVQIQCLMQILANRLSLIMYNPAKERRLKLGLLLAIGLINVSVFCIWVPARLQISQTYIHVNLVWDRVEKAMFAAIDLSFNTYFMWLLKSKLIASGLTQYDLVYKYNIVMVVVSISLDILIIGLMSLRDDAVYIQVHPLTFLTKLNIEMNMAELLGKVVKKSTERRKNSLPSADIWTPRLGISSLDHEWLGSAKDIVMPGSGGGQRHEMNMDMLKDLPAAKTHGDERAGSSSGVQAQGDLERWQSLWGVDGVGSVMEVERKGSGDSGVHAG